MRKMLRLHLALLVIVYGIVSCKEKTKIPAAEAIADISLKKGDIVACGPPDKEFGAVNFTTSCSEKVRKDFDLGVALLHSFEYDESEKAFAKVIEKEPSCAMAYWGVAMSNYHPLWSPPTAAELEKGARAIAIAQSIPNKSSTEAAFIDAIELFFRNHDKSDHKSRSMAYAKAMEKLYADEPASKEAAIFYALALIATADPADKTFANQKKAGTILTGLYPEGTSHPGIVHYIIHTYDSPELAHLGLDAARKYASIAPSSAHAQHMPSHIFTRLGLWDECINSNYVAASSATCYAQSAKINGHWDEELHALDYLMYGYLQKGDNEMARKQLDYIYSINQVEPINFKVLYSLAASPSRYYLENRMWEEAAALRFHPSGFPWSKYPWQEAIVHFAKAMGSVHTGQLANAKLELKRLQILRDTLFAQNDSYKTNQVDIQIKSADAWIHFKQGRNEEALTLMTQAADMEDRTEKHAVTPGEVLPARELLADMLLAMNQPAKALREYETDLNRRPNRFNAVYGAALAAEKMKDKGKASSYYSQLVAISGSVKSNRPELQTARLYLERMIAMK
jgi:tetratricopeptide (TPR) repeat protein